jgi:hypothetical protein
VDGCEEPCRYESQPGELERIRRLPGERHSDEDREHRNERGKKRSPRCTEEHDRAAVGHHQYDTCQASLAKRLQNQSVRGESGDVVGLETEGIHRQKSIKREKRDCRGCSCGSETPAAHENRVCRQHGAGADEHQIADPILRSS